MHGLPLSVNLKIHPKAPADNNARINFGAGGPAAGPWALARAETRTWAHFTTRQAALFGFNIKRGPPKATCGKAGASASLPTNFQHWRF